MKKKVVYFFLFTFKKNKFWAFSQMGINNKYMKNAGGLLFHKFMGSGGKTGFSLFPDFSTYALVSVWDSMDSAEKFIKSSELISTYKIKSHEIRVLILDPFHSHGLWSGVNPFKIEKSTVNKNSKIAIITRATLNFSKLISFWKSVPDSSKAISKAKGVYYFKGIGEIPFIQQATISLWNSLNDVLEFAYKSKSHSKIVKKTRKENWYKEELFSRFYLIKDFILK